MKVIAAYLLAVLGGNSEPSEKDIKKILKSVGAEADSDEISKLLEELDGKDVFEVIEQGKSKLAAVPVGGGGASAAAAQGAGAAESTAAAEEEKKEEEEEEEDDDLMGGLF